MTEKRSVNRRKGITALMLAMALGLLLAGCAGQTGAPGGEGGPDRNVVAGSSMPQTAQDAMAFLEGSLRPCDGGVEFTLPEGWPGEDWNIQILGRADLGEGEISVRVLETVNETGAWKPGGLYQIECDESYRELNLSAALYSDGKLEPLSVDLLALAQGQPQPETVQPAPQPVESLPESGSGQDMTQRVSAQFPAYQQGRTEFNGAYYDRAPFTASFLLPQGWSLQEPEQSERVFDEGMNTQLLVCDGEGRAVGRVGYGLIGQNEPDQQPEAGEYYKLVYSALRIPSSCFWEDYRAVKRTASGENGVATVYFSEQEPGQNTAAAEEGIAQGAMAYDKELGVYVALRMEENSPLSADQVETLAQSITLAAAA